MVIPVNLHRTLLTIICFVHCLAFVLHEVLLFLVCVFLPWPLLLFPVIFTHDHLYVLALILTSALSIDSWKLSQSTFVFCSPLCFPHFKTGLLSSQVSDRKLLVWLCAYILCDYALVVVHYIILKSLHKLKSTLSQY